jgi:hypothetical protein
VKTSYFFLFIILLLSSCNRKQEADRFTIEGQFSNSRSEKIVLCEMDVKEVVPLDSSNIGNDGTINFSHKVDQPGFYFLTFPGGKRIILLVKRGENILIKGDLKEVSSDYMISGSEGSELLEGFFHATLKNKTRIDSVKSALSNQEGSEDFLRFSMTADSLFFRISGDQKKLEKDFIDRNPQSLASLMVLNYSFGPKPVLTMEEDLSYYQKLTGLYRIYPKNKHVLFHMARVSLFINNLKNPIN